MIAGETAAQNQNQREGQGGEAGRGEEKEGGEGAEEEGGEKEGEEETEAGEGVCVCVIDQKQRKIALLGFLLIPDWMLDCFFCQVV